MKRNGSTLLGQFVESYGKSLLLAVIAIISFCVWAVPSYLVSQASDLAASRYLTYQQAADMISKANKENERRFNERLNMTDERLGRIENRLNEVFNLMAKGKDYEIQPKVVPVHSASPDCRYRPGG